MRAESACEAAAVIDSIKRCSPARTSARAGPANVQRKLAHRSAAIVRFSGKALHGLVLSVRAQEAPSLAVEALRRHLRVAEIEERHYVEHEAVRSVAGQRA
jgi:hypothetical protein